MNSLNRTLAALSLFGAVLCLESGQAAAEPFLGKMKEYRIVVSGDDQDFQGCGLNRQKVVDRIAERMGRIGLKFDAKAADAIAVEFNVLYEDDNEWCAGAINLAVIREAKIIGIPGRVSVWNRLTILYDDAEYFDNRSGRAIRELLDLFEADWKKAR